jgi:hypothetical protein
MDAEIEEVEEARLFGLMPEARLKLQSRDFMRRVFAIDRYLKGDQ